MKHGRDYGLTQEEFNEWRRLETAYQNRFNEWKGDREGKWAVEKACMRVERFEYEHGLTDEICPREY